jgi:hypothetical protein
MAHGFFTIEQWQDKQWVTLRHIAGDQSLSAAIKDLEHQDKPGFFRIVQTQRMIWAEKRNGKLRLRMWHASDPETLLRTAAAFDRDGGQWPESQ